MSNTNSSSEDLTATELNLGKVLALIHKVLPRLEDAGHKADVQSALNTAVSLLESARLAHSNGASPASVLGAQSVRTAVAPQIAAVIAAAVSVVLDQPFRLVSVQQVTAPVVPHLNVWAVEGRTQIFMSHRVR